MTEYDPSRVVATWNGIDLMKNAVPGDWCENGARRVPAGSFTVSIVDHDEARRRQEAGLCPWHDTPEFGCEPCADRLARRG